MAVLHLMCVINPSLYRDFLMGSQVSYYYYYWMLIEHVQNTRLKRQPYAGNIYSFESNLDLNSRAILGSQSLVSTVSLYPSRSLGLHIEERSLQR